MSSNWKIPRWIKDNNPDESLGSRVVAILNAVTNGKLPDSDIQVSEIELRGWIGSELNSLWQKLQRDNLLDH